MKKGFTLAEVLITLSLIGVIASLTIPSVIVNYQNREFKSGFQKALNTINNAIALNKAEGKSPLDTNDLFEYLTKHLSVSETDTISYNDTEGYTDNRIFYTMDGMRFEVPGYSNLKLHETGTKSRTRTGGNDSFSSINWQACGSYGIDPNVKGRAKKAAPCIIMVDVNGDRPPSMAPNYNSKDQHSFSNTETFNDCQNGRGCYYKNNGYNWTKPNEKKLYDVYNIIITDQKAIPYGVIAQRMIYEN